MALWFQVDEDEATKRLTSYLGPHLRLRDKSIREMVRVVLNQPTKETTKNDER